MCVTRQVFLESGKAKFFGTDEILELNDGDFYGEEAFITTLSMMVEDNAEVRRIAQLNVKRLVHGECSSGLKNS